MKRYSLMYFISQSFKGLWRNGVMTMASVLVLLACLIVMGCFSLLVVNLNSNLDSLGALNEIVAFIEPEKTEEETNEIYEKAKSYPNVKEVTLVTKDQALEEEKVKYGEQYPSFFEGITSEVYPASLIVSYNDNNEVETLRYALENTEGIYKVNCRVDVASKLQNLRSGIIYVFLAFLAILFVVSIFVIINTIKLAVFARRQEINIMRYVGATNWFIMFPFILEGVIIGLISSLAAFGIQAYIYQKLIVELFSSSYEMIKIVPFSEIKMLLFVVTIAIGVVTGIIGSSVSLRKNLKA